MTFYLGTHVVRWMSKRIGFPKSKPLFDGIPLFVSARRLRDQKWWKPANTRFAIDSGGFTELSMYGKWTISPEQYVAEVWQWMGMIGRPDFVSPQDWMCEPVMIEKTGLSVRAHQDLTIANFLRLKELSRNTTLPFIPVIQGWVYEDYMRHIEDYKAAGIDLTKEKTVGVGSVCRRQNTGMAEELMRDLWKMGIKPHGFGFKLEGLKRCAKYMASADSMAWSLQARRSQPLPGCSHRSCANCKHYALDWHKKALRAVDTGMKCQEVLF